MKYLFFFFLLYSANASSQQNYIDSLQQYQQTYMQQHEVVTDSNKQFLSFYPVSENFKVTATVSKKENSPWFLMASSGPIKKMYRIYATATFKTHDTTVSLNLYQSQSLMQTEQYREHLFIPFTDATNGNETYEVGRYIDVLISDIKNNLLVIDFNKAYNPYCAYVSGKYNCPVPPPENNLPVAITAGEKAYGKH